jgi:hypothetical protein
MASPSASNLRNKKLRTEDDVAEMSSLSQKLAAWRAKTAQPFVPEQELLRDLLYVLQGIDGTHIQFLPASTQEQQGSLLVESGIQINETKVKKKTDALWGHAPNVYRRKEACRNLQRTSCTV